MKLLATLIIYLSICLIASAELRLVRVDRFLHARDDDHPEKLEVFVSVDQISEIQVANLKGDEKEAIVRVYLKASQREHVIHFSSRKEADAAAQGIRARILGFGDKG